MSEVSGGPASVDGRGPLGRLSALVRSRPICAFLAVAFGWTWSYDLLLAALLEGDVGLFYPLPRTWGVPIAAVLVTWASGGSLREWLRTALDWRVRTRWYLVAATLPIAVVELTTIVEIAAGSGWSLTEYPAWVFPAWFLVVLLFAGGLEELGWRGFVQSRLQRRYTAVTAALAVGIAWSLWHAPLFFVVDRAGYDANYAAYTVRLMAVSVVYAWLYNASGGSVVPAMVMHAAGNLPVILVATGSAGLPGALDRTLLNALLHGFLAAGLIRCYGRQYVAPSGPNPAIPGASNADRNERDRGAETE